MWKDGIITAAGALLLAGLILMFFGAVGESWEPDMAMTPQGYSEFARGSRGGYNASFVVPAIQDDGTYGNSMNYLYWWDTKGVYHQHYVTGGQIVHISAQPIAVKSVIINMETAIN